MLGPALIELSVRGVKMRDGSFCFVSGGYNFGLGMLFAVEPPTLGIHNEAIP